MKKITIELPDEAAVIAEKHARELGYDDASDWAFELLRNYAATREDALYHRMHPGEHNTVFGRSRREQADIERRAEAERAEAEKKRLEAEARAERDAAMPAS
jgi:hypothetical protein